MEFYEVVLRGSIAAQDTINRWSYVTDGSGTATALELLGLFGGIPTGSPLRFPASTVMGTLQAALNSQAAWQEIQVTNLYSDTDFYVAPLSPAQVGSIIADCSPPFVSYGFFSSRVRRDIHRSFKRFAGVGQDAYDSNGLISGGVLAELTVIAEAMSVQLTGDTATYKPATLGFERYDAPSGKPAYKPYATSAAQAAHVASPITWTAYETVRSQTSRQYGHGR